MAQVRGGQSCIGNEVGHLNMVWVWVVLSSFVVWTLGISLMRHETTPRALWEAIVANAVFGALVFLRGV